MGLNLRSILQPAEVSLADLAGETIAIDAYGLFYQFLTTLRDVQGRPVTDPRGQPVGHLIGLVTKTEELLSADVTPVFVFDGPPHPLKAAELARRSAVKTAAAGRHEAARLVGDHDTMRKAAAAMTYITREMVESACHVLDAAGLPWIRAPGDAEAQCAAMAAAGLVDAAASQDYDTLVYGAPRVLRNLTSASKDTEEILLAAFQMETGLNREGLVDLAMLVGNDFHGGVEGIGPKNALKLLRTHGSMHGFFGAVERGRMPTGAGERAIAAARGDLLSPVADEIRHHFLHPAADLAVRVRPRNPDASVLHERLVDVHGFTPGRSDRFATLAIENAERRTERPQTRLRLA